MCQTKSASALGGRHHVLTTQGWTSFFLAPGAPPRARRPGHIRERLTDRPRARGSSSNSRPSECDSSWFAHFDSDKMIRHHRDVEKDLRYGLLEPEPTRFRRSSACFGS